jgi:hypothetical protein
MEISEVRKDRNNEPYNTLEIYLAAWMNLNGFSVKVLPPDEQGKVFFSFDRNTYGFFKTLNEFNNKDTKVPLVDFVHEIKYLRGKMHQQKKGGARMSPYRSFENFVAERGICLTPAQKGLQSSILTIRGGFRGP